MRWSAPVALALTTLPCAVAMAGEKVPDALLAGVSFGINGSSLTIDTGGVEVESDANDTTDIAYGFKIGMRVRRDLDIYLVHDAALVNRVDNYGVSILGVGATYDTRRGGLIPKAIVALGKGYQANNSRDDAKTPEGWALIVGGEWPLHRDLALDAFPGHLAEPSTSPSSPADVWWTLRAILKQTLPPSILRVDPASPCVRKRVRKSSKPLAEQHAPQGTW